MNEHLKEWYDRHTDQVRKVIHDIWEHPQICFEEHYAAKTVEAFVDKEGFDSVILRDVRDFKNDQTRTPNCVIARYGHGHPVIAFVGELDALPGLGQEAVPYRKPIPGPGHGCGHCLMAGGAMAAACALRYAMEKEGLSGTVELIEAPAEEGGCGKGWLAANGVFDHVDMALMWHSSVIPFNFSPTSSLSVYDVDFEFFGKSAHAAGMPWNGRSALDAVQLMNLGIEFMREHMTPHSSVHYNITHGGAAANIVPDYASVHYMFRSADGDEEAKKLFERGLNIARGAAMMTETEMKYTITELLPHQYYNLPLCRFMDKAVKEVPPLNYTEKEYAFARELYENTMGEPAPEDPEELLCTKFQPYTEEEDDTFGACTDAAIMSHICPTIHYHGGGRLSGTPGHHWNVTSTSGMSIGEKGAIYAYSVLAQGAYNVLKQPDVCDEFWAYQKSLNIPKYKFYKTV